MCEGKMMHVPSRNHCADSMTRSWLPARSTIGEVLLKRVPYFSRHLSRKMWDQKRLSDRPHKWYTKTKKSTKTHSTPELKSSCRPSAVRSFTPRELVYPFVRNWRLEGRSLIALEEERTAEALESLETRPVMKGESSVASG